MSYHGFQKALVAPLHLSHMGEAVNLHAFSGDVTVTAVVRLPDHSRLLRLGADTTISGSLYVDEKHAGKLSTLSAATVRGDRFEITSIAPPVDGTIKVDISRTENEYTNATSAIDPL